MIDILRWLGILIMTSVRERRDVALENLALPQQLGVLKRRKGVPRLKEKDRVFWLVLSRIWPAWREALHLVKADTVVSWQRKSGGRPQASSDVRGLIKQMATVNP
jgi:putative transposase